MMKLLVQKYLKVDKEGGDAAQSVIDMLLGGEKKSSPLYGTNFKRLVNALGIDPEGIDFGNKKERKKLANQIAAHIKNKLNPGQTVIPDDTKPKKKTKKEKKISKDDTTNKANVRSVVTDGLNDIVNTKTDAEVKRKRKALKDFVDLAVEKDVLTEEEGKATKERIDKTDRKKVKKASKKELEELKELEEQKDIEAQDRYKDAVEKMIEDRILLFVDPEFLANIENDLSEVAREWKDEYNDDLNAFMDKEGERVKELGIGSSDETNPMRYSKEQKQAMSDFIDRLQAFTEKWLDVKLVTQGKQTPKLSQLTDQEIKDLLDVLLEQLKIKQEIYTANPSNDTFIPYFIEHNRVILVAMNMNLKIIPPNTEESAPLTDDLLDMDRYNSLKQLLANKEIELQAWEEILKERQAEFMKQTYDEATGEADIEYTSKEGEKQIEQVEKAIATTKDLIKETKAQMDQMEAAYDESQAESKGELDISDTENIKKLNKRVREEMQAINRLLKGVDPEQQIYGQAWDQYEKDVAAIYQEAEELGILESIDIIPRNEREFLDTKDFKVRVVKAETAKNVSTIVNPSNIDIDKIDNPITATDNVKRGKNTTVYADGEIVLDKARIVGIDKDKLDKEIDWQEVVMPWAKNRGLTFPRKLAYYGDKGTDYSFSGVTFKPKPWSKELLALKAFVEEATGVTFNSALLNRYEGEQHSIGMHADDESVLGKTPYIASVSFGDTVEFKIQNKKTGKVQKIKLSDGDLLIFQGLAQELYMHGIDKNQVKDFRINVTFRRTSMTESDQYVRYVPVDAPKTDLVNETKDSIGPLFDGQDSKDIESELEKAEEARIDKLLEEDAKQAEVKATAEGSGKKIKDLKC